MLNEETRTDTVQRYSRDDVDDAYYDDDDNA